VRCPYCDEEIDFELSWTGFMVRASYVLALLTLFWVVGRMLT
jgi:hypothetical protein